MILRQSRYIWSKYIVFIISRKVLHFLRHCSYFVDIAFTQNHWNHILKALRLLEIPDHIMCIWKVLHFFQTLIYFEEELHLNKKVSKMATWPNFDRILNWIIKSLNEENRKSAALTKKDDRNVIREKERENISLLPQSSETVVIRLARSSSENNNKIWKTYFFTIKASKYN